MEDYKLLLFGGKGGVGKTTMATASALHASFLGKKVLILSTDPAHSLSDSFSVQIGNKITKIKNNLDALEIDSAVLLEEYKKKYGDLIKQIADEGTFFSKDDIQQFFDLSLPGMDELMALLKIIEILSEEKYDLLILDTAPTGHTIRLLELPEIMIAYIKVLAQMRRKHHVVVSMMTRAKYVPDKADEFINKMYNDIERLKVVLKESTTSFVPVLIPEKMAIAETQRLIGVLEKSKINIDKLILNRGLEENCSFCKSRHENQEKYFTEIKKIFSKYKVNQVPLLANEIKGNNLETVAKILFEEKYELPQAKIKKTAQKPFEKLSFEKLKIKKSTKFLLFGGKGGVGKTSCAAATALKACLSKKVLVFSTDPAHSLSDSFGVLIGNKITKIKPNLDGLEVDSSILLNDLKKKYRKEIQGFFSSVFKPTTHATIDAPYDRKVMEGLFDLCPPGIDEIMALKTMMDLMKGAKYDLFILDTAPTGHTIRLLEMPEIAEEWVATLLNIQEQYPISFEIGETLQEMLETIKKVRLMLADSSKSEFVAVGIPEAMSVFETTDLVQGLKRLKVATNYLVVNMIIPASKCTFCSVKRSEQERYVKELSKLGLKVIPIEMFASEVQGEESLVKFGKSLF